MHWVQRAALLIVLVLTAAAPAQASFPGSNGRIAYFTTYPTGVHTIKPDGTGEETLSRSGSISALHGIGVAWSPDGRRLASADVRSSLCCESGWIFTVNSDGTGETYVTPPNTPVDEKAPTWSPDGRTIAFESHNFTTFFDDLGSRDTTAPARLRTLAANQALGFEQPAWSPDGTRFAFTRQASVANNCDDLWTSDARGRTQVDVTNTPNRDEMDADWSPDSRQIVFSTSQGEPTCSSSHHIAVMNADGTNVRVLTADLPGELANGQGFAKFSPDGRQIAYQRNRGSFGEEIWIMNADGTGDHKLVDGEGPAWQPIPVGAATPPSPGSPVLASVFSNTPVGGGGVTSATVTLDRAAPTGGTVVQLASSNTSVATVPASVTVPGGFDHVDFTVTGGHPATDTSVTITATLGTVSKTATTTVQGTPGLKEVTLPASVGGGLTALGGANFTTAAFDEPVTLTSSDPTVASVPATVIAGGTGVTFVVHTQPVATPHVVTITATFRGQSKSATMTVAAGDPFTALTAADGTVAGVCPSGKVDNEVLTVHLSSASWEAVPVSVSTNDPDVEVPATVQASNDLTGFIVAVLAEVPVTRTATITATALGITKTVQLRLVPCGGTPPPTPAPTALSLNPSSVTGGATSQGTVTIASAAPAGGASYSLTSGNTAASVPATVVVPAGATTGTFTVTTTSVNAQQSATITVTGGGASRSATLTVNPAAGPPPPPPPGTDTVRVTRAQYDSAKRELRVEATSTNASATLQALNDSTGAVIGPLQGNGGTYKGQFTNVNNPGTVRVTSSLGGSATLAVTGATGTVRPAATTPVSAAAKPAPTAVAKSLTVPLLHATSEVALDKADPQDRTAPKVGFLRALPRRIRVGSLRGTLVSFTLSEAARVTLSFQRLHGTRFARVAGRLERTLPKGRVRIRFNGLLAHGAALRPGVYRVVVDAVDASGNRAAQRRLLVYLHPAAG